MNGGPHVGRLWTSAGTLLGSVTFTNETDSGWQEAIFSTPIQVTANTVYVVSYFAPQGHYANDNNFFDPKGGFPVFSNMASNYWVDVIFVPVQQP